MKKQRSKSQSQFSPYFRGQGRSTSQNKHPIKTEGQEEINQDQIPENCGAHQTTSRKCEYCISHRKYPNYLHELRKDRIEKEKTQNKLKKEAAEAYLGSLISNVPMIESHNMNHQIITEFSLEEKKTIPKQSNLLFENEQALNKSLNKSVLESLANGIIRSNPRKEIEKYLMHEVKQKDQYEEAEKEDFCFEIKVHSKGAIYSRKFTALEYGRKAVACIQEILERNY